MFLRVEETLGRVGLQALLAFFDARLHIVTDVKRELDYRANNDFSLLADMLQEPLKGHYLRGPAEALAPALVAQVGPVAKAMPDAGQGGSRKNWGEVATVLQAVATQSV